MTWATLSSGGCQCDSGRSHTLGYWVHCRNYNGWTAVIYDHTVFDARRQAVVRGAISSVDDWGGRHIRGWVHVQIIGQEVGSSMKTGVACALEDSVKFNVR